MKHLILSRLSVNKVYWGKGGKGIGKGKSNVKSLVKSNAKSLGQGNTPCCQPATTQPRCCPTSTIQKHAISFAQASCSPTPSSSLRMGSLPKDTLCAYCGKRRAGCITDAYIGPLCFSADKDEEDDGESCYELGERLGWHVLENGYLARRWLAFTVQLSRENCLGHMNLEVCLCIARCVYFVQ